MINIRDLFNDKEMWNTGNNLNALNLSRIIDTRDKYNIYNEALNKCINNALIKFTARGKIEKYSTEETLYDLFFVVDIYGNGAILYSWQFPDVDKITFQESVDNLRKDGFLVGYLKDLGTNTFKINCISNEYKKFYSISDAAQWVIDMQLSKAKKSYIETLLKKAINNGKTIYNCFWKINKEEVDVDIKSITFKEISDE